MNDCIDIYTERQYVNNCSLLITRFSNYHELTVQWIITECYSGNKLQLDYYSRRNSGLLPVQPEFFKL